MDHAVYSMNETVEKTAVIKEEGTKVLIYGEDTVPVLGMDQIGSHFESTGHSIFSSTGRVKTAMTAERNKF